MLMQQTLCCLLQQGQHLPQAVITPPGTPAVALTPSAALPAEAAAAVEFFCLASKNATGCRRAGKARGVGVQDAVQCSVRQARQCPHSCGVTGGATCAQNQLAQAWDSPEHGIGDPL
jgi:hypothetical protein